MMLSLWNLFYQRYQTFLDHLDNKDQSTLASSINFDIYKNLFVYSIEDCDLEGVNKVHFVFINKSFIEKPVLDIGNMKINDQTGVYEPVVFSSGDVVFAGRPRGQPWPARVIRRNVNHTLRVQLFAKQQQLTVNPQKVQPFDSLTIQRFSPVQSSATFRQALDAACKYLEGKQGSHPLKFELADSVEEQHSDVKEHKEQRIEAKPGSDNLFSIYEANEGLEQSQDNVSINGIQVAPNTPKSGRKHRNTDQLLIDEQRHVFAVEGLSKSRQQETEYISNNTRSRRSTTDANSNTRIASPQSAHLPWTGEDVRELAVEDQAPQDELPMFGPLNLSQLSTEASFNSYHSLEGNNDNDQMLPQTELPMFGPLNISQLSTEASLNSYHSSENALLVASTAASLNDDSPSELSEEDPKGKKQVQVIVESSSDNASRSTNQHAQQQSKSQEIDRYQQSRRVILVSIDKLLSILSGGRNALTFQEQLSFAQSLESYGLQWTDRDVLKEAMGFMEAFPRCNSTYQQKCYIQWLVIREKLHNLYLRHSSQKQRNELLEEFEANQHFRQIIRS